MYSLPRINANRNTDEFKSLSPSELVYNKVFPTPGRVTVISRVIFSRQTFQL